jgi:hypothetical protein
MISDGSGMEVDSSIPTISLKLKESASSFGAIGAIGRLASPSSDGFFL